MAELHLIGTLAHDPDGPARLAALLDEVQPDILAIEASDGVVRSTRASDRASAATLDAIGAKGADPATLAFWRRRLAREQMHYEAFTTAAYALQHARPLHFLQPTPEEVHDTEAPNAASETGQEQPLDGSQGADGEVTALQFADLETLQGIAAYDWPGDYARNYARARVDLEAKACLEFLLPLGQQATYYATTLSMARRLALVLNQHERRRVAAVCALTQLYFSEARLTLYSQLYDAVAQRYITDAAGAIRDHPIVLPWASEGRQEAFPPSA
jgi:hypothetical protein